MSTSAAAGLIPWSTPKATRFRSTLHMCCCLHLGLHLALPWAAELRFHAAASRRDLQPRDVVLHFLICNGGIWDL
jgi:hypothetical protein